MQITIIFDFKKNSDLAKWAVVNDVVMGGKSNSILKVNAEGHGIFQGEVSLENNGGFSSIRYKTKQINVEDFSSFVLRVKGDGKDYRLRVKTNTLDYYSYEFAFYSKPGWQTVEIPFNEMVPVYRGRQLERPNYPGRSLEEFGFLIGNKKAEKFAIEIDNIALR